MKSNIQVAQNNLFAKQNQNGAWFAASDMGPICTAQVLSVLLWTETCPKDLKQEAIRWLISQQQVDGSYLSYPFAPNGSLSATLFVWAAFKLSGMNDNDDVLIKLRSFVESKGGIPPFLQSLSEGDLSPIYLAMAKITNENQWPQIPSVWAIIPKIERILQKKLHSGVILSSLQIALILHFLKKKKPPEATLKTKIIEWTSHWQNSDGSVNGNSIQTALSLAAYHAVGVSKQDWQYVSAVKSLTSSHKHSDDGSWFFAFEADVWTTALNLRALLKGGIAATDKRLVRATEYLLNCQSQVLQPIANQNKVDACRLGGWPFQKGNDTMVDCDDTAMVIGVLNEYLIEFQKSIANKPRTKEIDFIDRINASIQLGQKWLLSMQNTDGGWPAFVWGFNKRKTGPLMQNPRPIPKTFLDYLDFLLSPPEEMNDPSTEDVTARVLYALSFGKNRINLMPHIDRALHFLRYQQCAHGGFWGRWVVNYLPSTAYALTAAGHLGLPTDTHWVRDALQFVLKRQNSDGGFGETELSYADPTMAGVGKSTPALTALVLSSLIDIGLSNSNAAKKAAQFLENSQRTDGTWDNANYLATFVPPNSFYIYPGTVEYAPLEALSKYYACASAKLEPQKSTILSTPGNLEFAAKILGKNCEEIDVKLNHFCEQTDPLADQLISKLLSENASIPASMLYLSGGSASKLATKRFLSNSALSSLEEYIASTNKIPPWIDYKKIEYAQNFFKKNHLAIGYALFFATLPQSYAAAEGAKVLSLSYGLEKDTEFRILTTANYVYDVLSKGSFLPNGKALARSRQVRLGHSMVRHNVSQNKAVKLTNPPIHQEHMLGTVLLLSSVVIDALLRLGIQTNNEEKEAWIHLWNVAGYFMGTNESLLPKDYHEAWQYMDRIRSRQWQSSAKGAQLIQALIQVSEKHTPVKGLSTAMIYHLCGDQCAQLLGIKTLQNTATLRNWIGTLACEPWATGLMPWLTLPILPISKIQMKAQYYSLQSQRIWQRSVKELTNKSFYRV